MPSEINVELCTGCGDCVDNCPTDVIELKEGKAYLVYPEKCTECGSCELVCPEGAIKVKEELYV